LGYDKKRKFKRYFISSFKEIMRKLINKPVYVEWFDSRGGNGRWNFINEEIELGIVLCKTLGFLIRESEEYILIMPHLIEIDRDKQGCGDMMIYKKQIKKIQEVVL
jgi:hypothetical protein